MNNKRYPKYPIVRITATSEQAQAIYEALRTEYHEHHQAMWREQIPDGYIGIQKYEGRFEKGYKIFRKHNNNFALVTYYIKEKKDD